MSEKHPTQNWGETTLTFLWDHTQRFWGLPVVLYSEMIPEELGGPYVVHGIIPQWCVCEIKQLGCPKSQLRICMCLCLFCPLMVSFSPSSLSQSEDKQKAAAAFARLQAAMETLGISESERRALWRVLAAIYHLGAAGACKGMSFLPAASSRWDRVCYSSSMFWKQPW